MSEVKRGRGRPRKTPVVANVQPELVQTPAPQAAPPKKRERSVAAIEAEKRYKEKKTAEKKAQKEAEAAELAAPLPELWEKNRIELKQCHPAKFSEMYQLDLELNDLLYWVRNIEEGVKLGLQPGDGWHDEDFNEDGTIKDESKPTMRDPLEVLSEVRAAKEKYDEADIIPTMEDARNWCDFKQRRAKDKALWDYGCLSRVPLDTEWRVIVAISELVNRGGVLDEGLLKVAREFRPKPVIEDQVVSQRKPIAPDYPEDDNIFDSYGRVKDS